MTKIEDGTILSMSVRHLHAVERHAAGTYPEECCGVLLGKLESGGEAGTGRVRVDRVLPARNDREGDRDRGYLLAPETVLAARREARALDLEVVGYYHSHPDSAAEPSGTDGESAWPEMSYLIVAVEEGEPVAVRSWRFDAERQEFEEESLEPVGDQSFLTARLGVGAADRSAGGTGR